MCTRRCVRTFVRLPSVGGARDPPGRRRGAESERVCCGRARRSQARLRACGVTVGLLAKVWLSEEAPGRNENVILAGKVRIYLDLD